MEAHKLRVEISEDHRLTVDLPQAFPAGPAEVIVLAVPREARPVVRLGGALSPAKAGIDGDPIAAELRQLREERAAEIEDLAVDLERAER